MADNDNDNDGTPRRTADGDDRAPTQTGAVALRTISPGKDKDTAALEGLAAKVFALTDDRLDSARYYADEEEGEGYTKQAVALAGTFVKLIAARDKHEQHCEERHSRNVSRREQR